MPCRSDRDRGRKVMNDSTKGLTSGERVGSAILSRVAPRRRYGRRSASPAGARDRDRSRRPARLAATVLVVGLVLLGAAAAEAQTERILVSNTAVADDDTRQHQWQRPCAAVPHGWPHGWLHPHQGARQLRGRRGRRLRRRGLRGGWQRGRVSIQHLHGSDGAERLHGRARALHARRPRPLGETPTTWW